MTEADQCTLRLMARALARNGLSGPFGHCSLRLDTQRFLVCAPRPMGLIASGEPGTVVNIEGPLPEGVLGEVRIHQQVYRLRPDAKALCRFLSPQIMALAALGKAPKARHGFGAYFAPEPPFWPDPQLVRNDDAARGVAQLLGQDSALVLNINGAITVGETPAQALGLAWLLEDAARVELIVQGAAPETPPLPLDQARQRATWQGGIAERLWDYMTRDDPEADTTTH
ncbi:MAG: class II aldolase/adducin family protein [Rhodocyclaceae bacterium]|nr:MAG: class II aldolase/adducin family protein [Rhodocyclaceae bacterium]